MIRILAIALPLSVALAFACSAVFQFGRLAGLEAGRLIAFFTFGDYVNLAVPAIARLLVLVLLAFILVGLFFPHLLDGLITISRAGMDPRQPPGPARSRWQKLSPLALIAAAVAFGYWQIHLGSFTARGLLLSFGSIVLFVLCLAAISRIGKRHFHDRAVGAAISVLFLLAVAWMGGWISESAPAKCTRPLRMGARTIPAPRAFFALERGLALVWQGHFSFVPWGKVDGLDVQEQALSSAACAPQPA